VAWALLVSILAGLAIFPILSAKSTLLRKVPLEKPPEALEDEARTLVKRIGYEAPPTDRISGFAIDEDYQSYVEKNDPSPSRWDGLETGRPAIVYFWFRQSPRYLVPQTLGAAGRPTLADPPREISGMVEVRLDPRGRLIELEAVPPELDDSKGPWPAPDWAALFESSGLEIARFTAVGSTWVPPVFSDSRAAWEGVFPDRPGIKIRVEAGAYHGRPVSFKILGAWSAASRMVAAHESPFITASSAIGAAMFVTVLIGSMSLAWRNLRLGRGDRRGAFRLAACFFSTGIVSWLLGSSHVPPLSGESGIFAINLAIGLLAAAGTWTVYMAMEPMVRRHWPDMIISWSRLLAGRYRDPLVGRDILIGGLAGVARVVLDLLYHLSPGWFGLALQAFHPLTPETLRGARSLPTVLFWIGGFSIGTSLILCFLILLLRIVMRRPMAAAVVLTLVMTGAQATGAGNPLINLTYSGLGAAILVFTLTRFGLLALIVSTFLCTVLLQYPITLDASAWYAGAGLFGLLSVAALAVYGFAIALAGHPLLRGSLLDEGPAMGDRA
jgi:serine/threonine-protein kinase